MIERLAWMVDRVFVSDLAFLYSIPFLIFFCQIYFNIM